MDEDKMSTLTKLKDINLLKALKIFTEIIAAADF